MTRQNDATPLVRLTHVERSFRVGEQLVHALHDVSLELQRGDYVSIMGPSGSGKSTLLNVLGLLDRLDSGDYFFEGTHVMQLHEDELAVLRRNRIGFVFQAFHLVPRLTAAENIGLPLMLAGVARDERQARVEQALRDFNLQERSQHRPDQLSGGQRQRVAIARATINRPLLLLADEPTGNLDHQSSLEVITVLETLNRQGITLAVVTHDHELGERAGRVIRMLDGSIRQSP